MQFKGACGTCSSVRMIPIQVETGDVQVFPACALIVHDIRGRQGAAITSFEHHWMYIIELHAASTQNFPIQSRVI